MYEDLVSEAPEASEALEAPEPLDPEVPEPEVSEAMEVYHGEWVPELLSVTGNSDRTGFNLSTDTESVLEPTWGEKYFGERETTRYGPL